MEFPIQVSECGLRVMIADMMQPHLIELKKVMADTIRQEFRLLFSSMHERTLPLDAVDNQIGSCHHTSSSNPNSGSTSSSQLEIDSPSLIAQQGSSASSLCELDALCAFEVACPVCSAVPANEKSFYEHIKSMKKNRHRVNDKEYACVLRPSHPDHHLLMSSFLSAGFVWDDCVCAFCDQLTGLLNPGSKRVYRPGGTGNNRRVRAFLQRCSMGGTVQHIEPPPGDAP